ncbi:MAG: cytochrome c biogenesis CcdA family protein [Pseudomonadota bacterium]
MDVSVLSAFLAGAVSFLSPCVLPLVPAYLCYMAGISMNDFRGEPDVDINADGTASQRLNAKSPLLIAAVSFVLGFSTVFVALGAGAGVIGQVLRAWQAELAFTAGVIIILMGLNFLGVLRISLLSREARFQSQGVPANPVSAYVMGLAFAFGWTPCIGPVLGPILTLAGGQETAAQGAGLLAVYSAGLGLPFIATAMFSGSFMRFQSRFRKHMGTVEKAIGVMLIIAGILFLTGGMQTIAFWLIEQFPALARLG